MSRPTTTELLLAETRQYAVLTPAQEFAIATRAAAGSRKARHLLVLHNLRFANYVALQYRFTRLPHGDMLSAVCAGMLTAAARFDPTRGVHFVTYATPLIRTAVRLLVIKAAAALSLPRARAFAAFGETASLSFDVPMRVSVRDAGAGQYTLSDVMPDDRPAIDDAAARGWGPETVAGAPVGWLHGPRRTPTVPQTPEDAIHMLMTTTKPIPAPRPAQPALAPAYLAAGDAADYLGIGLTHFTNVVRPLIPYHNLSAPGSDRQVIRWFVPDLDAYAAARRQVA